MRLSFILLLMPAWAIARITIDIEASSSKDQTSVKYKGTDNNVISDEERHTFNLTASALKAAIKKYVGGTPLDVFVKSPTPWGDLYKTYNWSEVKRNTEVKKINIIAVKTKTVTLANKHFSNELKGDTNFIANMKANVVNYVKNTFSGKKVSVNVQHDVQLKVGTYPQLHMVLLSDLSKHIDFIEVTKTIQADTEAKFILKPAQSAICILNATRVDIQVSIDYESSLSGNVAANYNPKFEGHHFWAYDVKELMDSVGVSTVQKRSELVSIQYFTDAMVYVKDNSTGNTLVSVPADYVP